MNIYDFDNTIYNGDTNIDLILYSFYRHPLIVTKSLLSAIITFIKYKRKKIQFEQVKEKMLSFLFKIKNLDSYLDKFVEKKMHNIKPWYLESKKNDDIIISASYELWIKKFCSKLNIKHSIGTVINKNGKIVGRNCSKEEKVVRLNKEYPNIKINNAYSDSLDDIPMLKLAKKAYLVKKNKIVEYDLN